MTPRLVRETKSDLRLIIRNLEGHDYLPSIRVALQHAETALARLEAAHKAAPQITIRKKRRNPS